MKISVVLVAVWAALMMSACGATKQSTGHGDINTGKADVVAFPQGFRNVAHKCDGKNMVYSASRGVGDNAGSIAVVPNDIRC